MITKLGVCLLALIISVQSRPNGDSKIEKFVNDLQDNGYHFMFVTSDNIAREENGVFQPISENQGTSKVTGNSYFLTPEGIPVSLTYVADERGYRPSFRIGHETLSVPTAAIASISGGGIGK